MKPASKNYKILRNILSKIRKFSITPDISYLVIYSFLYKYCSDLLRDHFLSQIQDKALTLDEAYAQEHYREMFRDDAFHMFGYYINSPDCFFDEVINNKYSENFFLYEFFTAFSQHVEFVEGSNYQQYFRFIFDSVSEIINFNKYEFEGENHLMVKEIIFAISKLDIFEEEFPFDKVYDRLCQSKLIEVETDPDYITSMLSCIVKSEKDTINDIYNPFLCDASSIINLSSQNYFMANTYAKSQDKITYCSNIVKLFINLFDLDHIFLEYGSPFESADVKGASFDVITSRIPPLTSKNIQRLNRAQRIEIAKRNKRKELEELLADKFNMNPELLENDIEMNNTIENLVNRMDLDADSKIQFKGEYESLKDSEYLFLINLIDSLKDDGIMVVAMSQSFLFKNTLQTLRKYLTFEKNCIDAIISIPNELTRPRSSEIIVVFRKNRLRNDVMFIDLSTRYKLVRESYRVPGLFRKNLTLDGEFIKQVVDIYRKREIVDRFSNIAGIDEIASKEFNLSVSRYVDTFEGEFIKLADLKNEKEEITSRIKKLNKKIDMMMDELNLKL